MEAQVPASATAVHWAQKLWEDGHGVLPPEWEHDMEGNEVYFIAPGGETQWEDPRETLFIYTQHFAAAERRGLDLAQYLST